MVAILLYRLWPFVQIFNSPLTEDSTWSLKKLGARVSEELFKGVNQRTDNKQQVIKIAHPEPLAQVS